MSLLAEQSGTAPTALDDKPELFPDLDRVARAFALLTRGRPLLSTPFGTAEGAIPLAEIAAYCALFGISDPDEFVPLLRSMDEAYLRARAEQAPPQNKNAHSKKKD